MSQIPGETNRGPVMTFLERTLRVAALILLAASLAACANTIRGAGKDIGQAADATGDAIEEIVE